MPLNTRSISYLAGIFIYATAGASTAAPWDVSLSPSYTSVAYQGSQQRERFSETSLRLNAEHESDGGLLLGLASASTNLTGRSEPRLQTAAMVSGHYNLRPGTGANLLTLRADGHAIKNNDLNDTTGNVNAFALQGAWWNAERTLYLDLGAASSRYQNALEVTQYTPTIGMYFNQGADWLQLRGYLIGNIPPSLTGGKTSVGSAELKWTHSFRAHGSLLPSSISVGLMGGERIYAVDMDAQSVANLPDVQKGGITLGANWNLTKRSGLFVFLGSSRYRNEVLGNDYQAVFGNAGLSFRF